MLKRLVRGRCGLVLGLLVLLAAPLRAQESRPPLGYITKEAFAGVVIKVGDLLAAPEMELFPREVFTAVSMSSLGFDAMEIEEFVIFAEPPAASSGNPMCLVLRFKKETDLSSAFLVQQGEYEEGKLEGKRLLRARGVGAPDVLFADERTLLVGDREMLIRAAASKRDEPVVAEKLAAPRVANHAALVAVMPPIRELVRSLVGDAPQPPPITMLTRIVEDCDVVEATINMRMNGGVKVRTESASTESAERVEIALNGLLLMAREAALAPARQLNRKDPLEEASGRYLRRVVSYFEKEWKPQRRGREVFIEMKADKALLVAPSSVATALMLPAVQAAREAARRQTSANNLKQIALAMHNYHADCKRFPPRAIKNADGKPLLSWRVLILPYLGEQKLYDEFRLDEPWDSEHNIKLLDKMPKIFHHPRTQHPQRTCYLLPIGEGTAFAGDVDPEMDNIGDGLSHTILLLEVNGEQSKPWTMPEDYEVDWENPLRGLRGTWNGGFMVGLFDGSIRFISDDVDLNMFKAMLTSASGDAAVLP